MVFTMARLRSTLESEGPKGIPEFSHAALAVTWHFDDEFRLAAPSRTAIISRILSTEDSASLPMAMARALSGDTTWEGFELLSGSSVIDFATVLTLFCSQYSPDNWHTLLRQELPGLTNADIELL